MTAFVKRNSGRHKISTLGRAPKSTAHLDYALWSSGIAALLDESGRQAARSISAILTAAYWEIGRRIVEFEQQGERRADYGEELLERLGFDLTRKFGRGFAARNLFRMRSFYLAHPNILPTVSAKCSDEQFGKLPTGSAVCKAPSDKAPMSPLVAVPRKSAIDFAPYLDALARAFPLSWSHYVRLLSVSDANARVFYEGESLRGGWSARQLDRQVSTLFYERTALSKNNAKMLASGAKPRPEAAVSVEEEIKTPYVLEFLNLRDDYAEKDLEEALVHHLEDFLLELGNNFTFVARQKRIRMGKEWYRIDLLLYHRRLRCLIIFDLKVGRFTHADAGQMNLYVNYATQHLTLPEENPPVGLILCSEHDDAVAHYSTGNLRNKIPAAQCKLNLPAPRLLEKEIANTRRLLESPVRRKQRDFKL